MGAGRGFGLFSKPKVTSSMDLICSSVTWMRQRMTKLHLSFPRAGVYWVMIRGDDRAKVTIAVNILPKVRSYLWKGPALQGEGQS